MRCPAPADARASNATAHTRRTVMVLLASAYDQSRFFKAADLTREKKLRIKNVTEELDRNRRREGEEARRLVHQRRARPCAQSSQQPHDPRCLRRRHRRLDRQDHRRVSNDGWNSAARWAPALRVRIPPPKQATGNWPRPMQQHEAQLRPSRAGCADRQATSTAADDLDDEIAF